MVVLDVVVSGVVLALMCSRRKLSGDRHLNVVTVICVAAAAAAQSVSERLRAALWWVCLQLVR